MNNAKSFQQLFSYLLKYGFLKCSKFKISQVLIDFLKISFHSEAVNTIKKSRNDIFTSEVHQQDSLKQHECCGYGFGLVG